MRDGFAPKLPHRNMMTEPDPQAVDPGSAAAPALAAEGPVLGGYKLVQKLVDSPDGQIWAAQAVNNPGDTPAMVLLNQPAMRDPGAVWRVRQEFANLGLRMKLLVVDPPLAAEQSVSIQHIRAHRPANIEARPPRKEPTPEEARKRRRLVVGLVSLFSFIALVIILAYCGAVIAGVYAQHKYTEDQVRNARIRRAAYVLTHAADQWAAANSHPVGTPYTWEQIKDFAPADMRAKAVGNAGPLDELGRPYVYTATGTDVELDPASQATVDAPPPNIWGFYTW